MIIQINNVGPISSYEFDLEKDLHLIVGENNIGKSYASTVVYLIIKYLKDSLLQLQRRALPFSINLVGEYEFFDENTDFRPQVYLYGFSEQLHNIGFCHYLENSFKATFDSVTNIVNKNSKGISTITIDSNNITIIVTINNNIHVNAVIKKNIILQISERRINPISSSQKIIFYETNQNNLCSSVTEYLWTQLFIELNSQTEAIHFLPASRSGLYQALNAFSQIILEFSKSRSFLQSSITLPGIAEPLSDYFTDLMNAANTLSKTYRIKDPLDQKDAYLLNAIKSIQSNIIRGTIDFDNRSKKIYFSPDNSKLRLELSLTSTMVSELIPISMFLSDLFNQRMYDFYETNKPPKSILFIEEPEAHLHPEVQVQLTEIFAQLVKAGVKVVMTSHSNYIFSKVNNLIMAGELKPENTQVTVFKMEKEGSIGHNLPVDTMGVDDENFVDVTERIYLEKMALFARTYS